MSAIFAETGQTVLDLVQSEGLCAYTAWNLQNNNNDVLGLLQHITILSEYHYNQQWFFALLTALSAVDQFGN